jgi:hypothetical protein
MEDRVSPPPGVAERQTGCQGGGATFVEPKGLIMNVRVLLPLVLVPALAVPVQAGILFGKKTPKPPPQQRVPELINIVRSDGDEGKRIDAVDELRNYDPGQFPQIVPTLIEALLHDRKPAVRAEAAASLGKLRPVSQQAGQALEYARDNDPSMRVRLQARSTLVSYRWSGYEPGRRDDRPLITNKEPPLADPNTAPPPVNTQQPGTTSGRLIPVPPVSQPVLQPVPQPSQTVPTSTTYRPLPTGPTQPPPQKQDGPELPSPEQ